MAFNLAATLARSTTGHVLLVNANAVRDFEGDRPASLATRLLNPHNPNVGGKAIDFFRAPSLATLVPELRHDHSFIVFDAAAILDSSIAIRLANLVDGVVLVVEAERARWEVVLHAKDVLLRANAKVLGVVLNKRRYHVPEWLYRRL